jgi:hypothetical protein
VRRTLDRYFALTVILWLTVCTMSVVRVPVEILHPFLAGPRYFFYPFILLTWLGIYLAAASVWPVRALFAAGYVFTLAMAMPSMSRRDDAIDWRKHITACMLSAEYDVPIHYDGQAATLGYVHLSGAQCTLMVVKSWFRGL